MKIPALRLVAFTLLLCSRMFAQETVPLIFTADPRTGWTFNNGQEFPGATGSLAVDAVAKREGRASLKLTGDFTKGGNYVEAGRKIDGVDIRELSMWIRSPDLERFTVRINDASGQTHQIDIKTERGPDWRRVVLPLERFFAKRGDADAVTSIAKYESWGGAKDGAWHGPATAIYILIGKTEEKKQVDLWLSDVSIVPRAAAPLPFKIAAPIVLSRSLEKIAEPSAAATDSFKVAPGQWEVAFATKSALHSPDNSYNAIVQLECLDGSGKTIERITVADVFGERERKTEAKRVEVPKGAAFARFQIQLNKTHGTFSVEELSAKFLAPQPHNDDGIARLLFSTAQLGNLLFPDDSRRVSITVETTKPLDEKQRTISSVVRDYWGAEQMRPATAQLATPEKKDARFIYKTEIDLRDVPLEIGRYYELHAAIPRAGDEPFRNYTSLAILPEAATKKFKPEEIPFTSRNWDNRLPDYVRLTDRLGVRVCGIWGGWSSKPPYEAEAPTLDLAQKLGMGWLTNTPAATIEAGKTDYDEEALRKGVRNIIEKFGKVRPMFINLGNEPHGTGERVVKNVAAYRAIYEEVKKTDATIPVIATSVEPNEEYFKAGYGKWCDAYDFHIYETADDVRRTIGEYRALMKKYGVEKPLWSTELGLNSQGLTRHAVAVELIKKTATFFASGGANMSWFCLLYPDAEGKDHGSSGDSHNVFDCRYNHYAPRLDAIAYYNAVNAVAVKKFVTEKQYDGGISAFLFRDRENRSLQVLWKDKGRADVAVPLAGVKEIQVIRIDGSRRTLNADGKAITLTIGEDPLLLLYDGGDKTLPPSLGVPLAKLDAPPSALQRGTANTLTVTFNEAPPDLIAPPFWTVSKSPVEKKSVSFTATPPTASSAREGDFTIRLGDRGELYFRAPFSE